MYWKRGFISSPFSCSCPCVETSCCVWFMPHGSMGHSSNQPTSLSSTGRVASKAKHSWRPVDVDTSEPEEPQMYSAMFTMKWPFIYILEHVVWSGIGIFGMYCMSITKVKDEAYLGEEVHTYQNRNQHTIMKSGLSVVLWIGQSIRHENRDGLEDEVMVTWYNACPQLPLPYLKNGHLS